MRRETQRLYTRQAMVNQTHAEFNDIVVGEITLKYLEYKKCWVLPGGREVYTREQAVAWAERLNNLCKDG